MRRHPPVRHLVAVQAALQLAAPTGPAAAAPGCDAVLAWAHQRIESPTSYLPRWREVSPRDPVVGPPWAEGHYVRIGDPRAELGVTFRFVPDRLTLFGVVRDVYQISDQTASQAASDEAIDMIVDVAEERGWTLGPGETIPHADALSAIEEAGELCNERGVAPLPTLEVESSPGS